MKTLIKNGTIVNSESTFNSDIIFENGTITEIVSSSNSRYDKVIDASNKFIIPGGIDAHTHLDMPMGDITSADDFYTGTVAAAFGGTTTIIDFPTQLRGENILDALKQWHKKAVDKAVIDYGFHMIITELADDNLDVINELADEGVTSIKLFMAYPNSLMVDDATIYRVLNESRKSGTLVLMHAENGGAITEIVKDFLAHGRTEPINHALTRPAVTEAEAIYRSTVLAKLAAAPIYIVHVSSADGMKIIKQARDENQKVFGETCPQYLYLSLDDMGKDGFEDAKLVFTPPLREKWNLEKLWHGLADDSLQVVATDHCPFCFKGQKDLGKDDFTKIPNGGAGIEHRMQLMFQGVNENKISLNRWVELCCTNPAKIFGLYPKKGEIKVGADADIVIWDPEIEHTISVNNHHMNVDYSMYEGLKIKGNAETVISRGEIIIKDNNFIGQKGRGEYLKRERFSN